MVSEKRRAWYHFVTTLCAIVGGVFVVAGMVDGLVHGSHALLRKKLDLGATLNPPPPFSPLAYTPLCFERVWVLRPTP